jgi:hypothetical protein
MAVLLKCPACREKFRYDVSQGWPDECPICKTDINNNRDDDDVVVPNILSFKTKNTDGVARQVMDGSETRAGLAAAMAGVPVSDMSSLKITDLNDRNDSQFAAKEVVNPVTQQMDMIRARGGQIGFGATEAQAFATNAHAPVMIDNKPTPVEPYAGLRARNQLQRVMNPIGQAPLPKQITDNPNYRSPV